MFKKLKTFLFKNTSAKQTVAKNTFWLTVSNFGGRLLKAAVIIYAARVLGTSGYGVFSYAITLAGFFTLFMDPGINNILMRDASGAPEDKRRALFGTAFVMKIFLLVAGVLVVLFIAPYFSTLPGANVLLPIVALVLAFDTMREFFSSLIRTMEKMEWETAAFMLTNLGIVVFGFIFLISSPTPSSFGWGYVIGTAMGAFAALYFVRDYIKNAFRDFSSKLVGPILHSAWPFAITGALGILLTNTDILVISWMRSASEVGVYSAAIRIIQVLYIVPTIIQFSSLPLMARLANKDNARFRRVFEQLMGVIFVVSVPIALGGAVLGTGLMRFIFGAAYASGGWSLKILALTMLVDYPVMVVSTAIFAYHKQKNLIVSSAIGGISNVALDLILIPWLGITGSAIATLLAQIMSNAYLWHSMKKINHFTVLPHLDKVFFAGILMAIAVAAAYVLGVNVLIDVAIGAVVYALALYLLREPLLIEIKHILSPLRADAPGSTA